MKKALSIILICVFLCLSLTACAEKDKTSYLQKYSNVMFDAFDTVITITAYCKDESEFTEIFDFASGEFTRYHQLFDIYNSYDGVTNLKDVNDKAAEAPVSVDPVIIELVELSKEMYEVTGGRMNIAMGSVLLHWHNARERAEEGYDGPDLVPSNDVLLSASAHCNIEDVVIDRNANTIFFKDPELKLDVGAIAKGFATEKVIISLATQFHDHILINAGGNVSTLGLKPDDSLWTIGIQNPEVNGGEGYVGTVSIESASVVTSGVYERNFVSEGRVYHHIIDPDTLMPENRYLSVSIITKDSAMADALSTAVFNMELEQGKAYIDSLNGVEAMWILNDKTQVFSAGFEKYLNK